MKKAKRILSVLMCALLLMGTMTVSAFAADPTGSITIKNPTNSQATVAEKTFLVYKIFDAKASGDNIAYSWHGNDFINFFKAKTGSEKAQVAVDYMATNYTDKAFELSQFAEELHKYINANDIDPFTTKTAGKNVTSVTIGDLTYGYYMVYDDTTLGDSAVRSAIMLTSVDKNVEVTLKANRPQIQKTVLDNEGNYSEGTSSSIGDDVRFKIETIMPPHTMYSQYVYKIEDVMPAGLTFKEGSVKVYKNDVLVESGYDVSFANEKLTVNIHTDGFFAANEKISVIYDATVNTSAKKNMTNTAKLIYSNDPTNDGEDGSTGSMTDTAHVFSYQMILSKFAQDSHGNFMNKRLAGAEFELYEDGSNEPIKFSVVTANNDGHDYPKYVVDPNGSTTTLSVYDQGDESITIEHLNYGGHLGDIAIFGLAEGKYNLKETKAPDGYLLPEETFDITITDTIGILGAVGTLSVTGEHTGTGSIVNTNGMADEILTVWADITNKPGSALPETGGMGTTLFTVLGIILMAGAVSYVFMKRRTA